MASLKKKIGEILVEWGLLSPKEIAKALEHAARAGCASAKR